MKFLEIILNTSYDCTKHSPDRSPVFVFSKLVEEVCELSDVYHGIAQSEPLNGEVADVIISAVDLLYVVKFQDSQVYGCLGRDEIFDSVRYALTQPMGGTHVEGRWFAFGVSPETALSYISHHLGRITRLLNQPERSKDDLAEQITRLISYVGALACYVGIINRDIVGNTQVKVEQAIAHKTEKWRSKFGL